MKNSVARRFAAAALCAVILAAAQSTAFAQERAPGTVGTVATVGVGDTDMSAASNRAVFGEMYQVLSLRQKACYQALKDMDLAVVLAAGEEADGGRRVDVQVSDITGVELSGRIEDGEFLPGDNSSKIKYQGFQNDLQAAVIALRYDRPEMLWLDGVVSSVIHLTETPGGVQVSNLSYVFHLPYEGREQELYSGMTAAAADIAKEAAKAPDTYSRVLKAHQLIAGRAEYESDPQSPMAELLSHSAYSALVGEDEYEPVCDGYSKAFKLVLDQMGIDCVLVSSAGHMWNNVRMENGLWYNVDLTWNDGQQAGEGDYLLVGSQTVIAAERFCDQESHIEIDPFLDAGLTVKDMKYPQKSDEAYEYLGYDQPNCDGYYPQYPDVTQDHWAYEDIRRVTELGYFEGDSRGRFCPEEGITRAQFAKVMSKIMGVDLSGLATPEKVEALVSTYPDLRAGAWYMEPVAWAIDSGLMHGDGGGFRPNARITRQEMCVVLYRAFGLRYDEENPFTFADHDSIAGWARSQVYACFQAGLVKGDSRGSFNPTAYTKRAEAAAIFSRYADFTS